MKNPAFAALLLVLAPAFAAALPSGFRGLLAPNGQVLADKEIWDIGPQEGEKRRYDALGIILENARPSDLAEKRVGEGFKDQWGGLWTVSREEVIFRNKDAVCDEPANADGASYRPSNKKWHCYFVVPEFGAYRYENGRITGTISKMEVAIQQARAEKEYAAETKKRLEAGDLMVEEMSRTGMFQRLAGAMKAHVDAGAVKAGALQRQDFVHYDVEGDQGNWRLRFFNDHEGRGPKTPLGAVPGAALEQAGFALSPKYRTIVDRGGSGISSVDTLGLDSYVVGEAFHHAYFLRSGAEPRVNSKFLEETIKNTGVDLGKFK